MQGLIGRKIGMTRVFDDSGEQVPVTVLECGPCVVLQRKSKDGPDGYDAVQLGFEDVSERKALRPQAGHSRKHNLPFKRYRREFALDAGDDCKTGDIVNVSIFEKISHVDITGVTKGHGFQGVMHRYNMAGGPMTHGGNSKRRIGSIAGSGTRVYKGKLMPGHMGNVRVTQQNLKVFGVRLEENLLLVRGAVPGSAGAMVIVKRALKKGGKE